MRFYQNCLKMIIKIYLIYCESDSNILYKNRMHFLTVNFPNFLTNKYSKTSNTLVLKSEKLDFIHI